MTERTGKAADRRLTERKNRAPEDDTPGMTLWGGERVKVEILAPGSIETSRGNVRLLTPANRKASRAG